MSEVGHLNTEAAKMDPARFFAAPMDLVDEIMLSRGEKMATLERWRAKALHELAAANEGMATHGASGKLVRVLDEIKEAECEIKKGWH
jgi:hypothetical protein